jgi:hypothetical protein
MREQPTWRIPVGVLALVTALLVYGGVLALLLSPVLSHWPVLVQLPIYLVLGVIWLLPLRRFMIWMETGRFK